MAQEAVVVLEAAALGYEAVVAVATVGAEAVVEFVVGAFDLRGLFLFPSQPRLSF